MSRKYMLKKDGPNCYNCHYFYITWDKKFPYGCKGFGMKSKRLPSVDVFISSSEECRLFSVKKRKL